MTSKGDKFNKLYYYNESAKIDKTVMSLALCKRKTGLFLFLFSEGILILDEGKVQFYYMQFLISCDLPICGSDSTIWV